MTEEPEKKKYVQLHTAWLGWLCMFSFYAGHSLNEPDWARILGYATGLVIWAVIAWAFVGSPFKRKVD